MSETLIECTITYDRIQNFLKGTRDLNEELHKKWAIGFQLEMILKNIADEKIKQTNPELYCTQIRSTFAAPVLVNDKIQISTPKETTRGNDKGLILEITVRNEKSVASTFMYAREQTQEIQTTEGQEFQLTAQRASQTAYGIFREKPTYLEKSIGLASNAVFNDGKELIDRKKQEQKVPIYFSHKLELAKTITELKENDKIRINTNAKDYTNTDKDRMLVNITAEKEGQLLYKGQLGIMFINNVIND